MGNIKKLLKLANEFEGKLKGKFELPADHHPLMRVTKGGSYCGNCRFVDEENHACKNEYYIQWNGSEELPKIPLDELCSDWWEPRE